ncbi:MAG: hypothetical protein L6Q95_16095 [Planctomycetes bacterium]|nr:hypothetical protein [Planctomycetota bacterium]
MSNPISRWFTTDFRSTNTYSIGSSTVMMWRAKWWLMWLIIVAIVVLFPAPVVPVTRTRPRWSAQSCSSCLAGRARSFIVGTTSLMCRKTRQSRPCWRKTFARKRPTPGTS